MVSERIGSIFLGLVASRADRGRYPDQLDQVDRLDQLSPKHIAEVSKDLFTDRSLRYKLPGEGYLLYSVGPDGGSRHAAQQPPA